MKKFLILFLCLTFIFGGSLGMVQATDDEAPPLTFDPAESDSDLGSVEEEVNLGKTPPLTIASQIINAVLGFLGLIFLVLMIYAGFIWMNARGNEEDVTKAKKILTSAIIGLVIVLASFGIAQFVYEWVGAGTLEGYNEG